MGPTTGVSRGRRLSVTVLALTASHRASYVWVDAASGSGPALDLGLFMPVTEDLDNLFRKDPQR